MGTSHALSGATTWLAGCATAAMFGAHPRLATIGVGAAVTAAGALVSDLDHPKSLASRSLWPLTAIASWATRRLSWAVYRATRTDADDPRCEGTHRCLTHTWPFAVAVGLLASGIIAAVGTAWWAPLTPWWWLGMVFGLGCLVHVLGDWLTHSGVPLLWPFVSQGRRWRRFRSPLSFRTNSAVEHFFAVPLFAVFGLGSAWLLLDVLVPVGR